MALVCCSCFPRCSRIYRHTMHDFAPPTIGKKRTRAVNNDHIPAFTCIIHACGAGGCDIFNSGTRAEACFGHKEKIRLCSPGFLFVFWLCEKNGIKSRGQSGITFQFLSSTTSYIRTNRIITSWRERALVAHTSISMYAKRPKKWKNHDDGDECESLPRKRN